MEIAWTLAVDYLTLCLKSEEDLRVMIGHFVIVCKRRSMKVDADKSIRMVPLERRDPYVVYHGLETTEVCL